MTTSTPTASRSEHLRQLSGIDASFLYAETGGTLGQVCSVTVVDGASAPRPLTLEVLTALMAERLPRLPLLRQRLVEVPLGIDRPYWADDPDFDPEFHVRELALPRPGDERQLAEQVARIAGGALDHRRPLWELYLIGGLDRDRVALLAKFHHAAVDGMAGAEIMSTILDSTPERPPAAVSEVSEPEWRPPPIPGQGEMFVRGLVNLSRSPVRAARLQRRVLRTLPGTTAFYGRRARMQSSAFRAERDGGVLNRAPVAPPRLSFNRAVTPHRRWAFGTTSLDDVKRVKNAHGVTLNDVVMAVCAGGLRRWLADKGELPETPLVAMVPLSIRTGEAGGQAGNQVSAMLGALPTHLEDPLERLHAASEAMRAAKEEHAAISAHVLQDMSQFAMPALAARAARLAASMRVADYVNPPFNLVISNVPGPRKTLYLAGAEVLGYYPVSVVADGQGLNVTVQSYRDSLDWGLTACRELVPDVWDLMSHLTDSVDELVATVSS